MSHPITTRTTASRKRTTVALAGLAGAHHYLVDLYRLEGGDAQGILVPVKEGIVCPGTEVPLPALFSSGLQAPSPGRYGVVVSAVNEGGALIGRSEGGLEFSIRP